MHSAALYLTSNDVHAILTPTVSLPPGFLVVPGEYNRSPEAWPGFFLARDIGLRLFLSRDQWRFFFGVALQPKRKLSFLLEKILMTRV